MSGGGINAAGQWVKEKRANGAYLYPKDAMQKIYKAYFLKRLRKLMEQQKLKTEDAAALEKTISQLATLRWNVHANAPFGGPAQILEYVGRYTHKTAITAHRITEITATEITFTYKDYTDGKKQRVAAIHQQLNLPKPMPKVIMPFNLQMLQRTGTDYSVCPKCREGKMEIVASYLNHNGTLINIKDLQKLKNKASPMRKHPADKK